MSKRVRIPAVSEMIDSARLYKWDLEIGGFPGLNGALLNVRCHTSGVPQPNYGPVSIELKGFTKVESGAVAWNPITASFYEVDNYELLDGLYTVCWKQFHGSTGVQQPKNSYKGTIKMVLEGIDDAPRKIWTLYGTIINSFTYPDYGSGKTEAVDCQVELHYDYAEMA